MMTATKPRYSRPVLKSCEVIRMENECYRLRRADGFWSQGFPSPHAIEWHAKNKTVFAFRRPQSPSPSSTIHRVEAPPNAKRARARKPMPVRRADIESPARVIIAAARRLDLMLDADAVRAYREFFDVFALAVEDLDRAVNS